MEIKDEDEYGIEQENEMFPINIKHSKIFQNISNNKQNGKETNFIKTFWTIITIITIFFIILDNITNTNIKKENEKLNNNLKKTNYIPRKRYMRDINSKIGIAFVFESLFGNGIGRMLSLLTNELTNIEDKYDIYLITDKGALNDFEISDNVIRLEIYKNRTAIKELDRKSNIIYYVLSIEMSREKIMFFKSFNKKIINIMHGAYLASVFSNYVSTFRDYDVNKLFDAFITVVVDDYYVYKSLGFNNTFYIPNMYTFDASKTNNSNLIYNNIMVMGRENDHLKGGIYAIKAMSLIVKEIPSAQLYFISSDYRIDYIKELIKELNLTNNIKIIGYTSDITKYFLNSSVLLYPSLTESFPMVMNEGKAHGLPIVAFNVSYSPSYQKGVTLVEMLNVEQMSKEVIKLLKSYELRKVKGVEAKLSLKDYSNSETLNKWDRLFSILNKDDLIAYKKLQEYTFDRYYNEKDAKERLESSYNYAIKYNKKFQCHSFNDMINPKYIKELRECKEPEKNEK